MNKKILMSIMAIGLIAMLAGTGIFAYFSDTATTGKNTFTAGTLELYVSGPIITSSVDLGNLKPGDEISGTLAVKNMGTLDGYLYGRTRYTVLQSPNLADVMTVTFWEENNVGGAISMNLVDFVAQGWMPYGQLNSLDTYTFEITVEFDTDAGNDYQESSIEVWFDLYLNQVEVSP